MLEVATLQPVLCRVPPVVSYGIPALHMIPKKTGDWRASGDNRALNEISVPNRYNILHMQAFAGALHGATIFRKVGLARLHHQIPIGPANTPQTAINWAFGLFEDLRIPFDPTDPVETFQLFTGSGCYVHYRSVLCTSTVSQYGIVKKGSYQGSPGSFKRSFHNFSS